MCVKDEKVCVCETETEFLVSECILSWSVYYVGVCSSVYCVGVYTTLDCVEPSESERV